jgi:hypothetical protein
MGGVVEEATREGEVVWVLVAREFCVKNAVSCDFDGDGWVSPN